MSLEQCRVLLVGAEAHGTSPGFHPLVGLLHGEASLNQSRGQWPSLVASKISLLDIYLLSSIPILLEDRLCLVLLLLAV